MKRTIFTLVLILFASSFIYSQAKKYHKQVVGYVLDKETNIGLRGVQVEIRNPGGGGSATTGDGGKFIINNLPVADDYEVSLILKDFFPTKKNDRCQLSMKNEVMQFENFYMQKKTDELYLRLWVTDESDRNLNGVKAYLSYQNMPISIISGSRFRVENKSFTITLEKDGYVRSRPISVFIGDNNYKEITITLKKKGSGSRQKPESTNTSEELDRLGKEEVKKINRSTKNITPEERAFIKKAKLFMYHLIEHELEVGRGGIYDLFGKIESNDILNIIYLEQRCAAASDMVLKLNKELYSYQTHFKAFSNTVKGMTDNEYDRQKNALQGRFNTFQKRILDNINEQLKLQNIAKSALELAEQKNYVKDTPLSDLKISIDQIKAGIEKLLRMQNLFGEYKLEYWRQ